MTKERNDHDHRPGPCREAQSTLGRTWEAAQLRRVMTAQTSASNDGEEEIELALEQLHRHFASCSHCGDEAQALLDLDRVLERDFESLDRLLPAPTDACIDGTITEALQPAPERRLLRRLRRGARFALWGTFFGLLLVLACAMIVAAHRILTSSPIF